MNKKKCATCKEEKGVSLFGRDKYNKDGLNYDCKECKNRKARARIEAKGQEYKKERNAKYREWRKKYYASGKGVISSRKAHLKRKFGITLEEYEEMEANQNGVCAICGEKEENYRNKVLSVDHNHDTGTIRGLLCGKCNLGLGSFNDSIEKLTNAIKIFEEV